MNWSSDEGGPNATIQQDGAKFTITLDWGSHIPQRFAKHYEVTVIANRIKKLWYAGNVFVDDDGKILVYLRHKGRGWWMTRREPGKGVRTRLRRSIINQMVSAVSHEQAEPWPPKGMTLRQAEYIDGIWNAGSEYDYSPASAE